MVIISLCLFANFGKLSNETRQRLVDDQLVCLEESIPYSVTYKHYRSPRQRYRLKKNGGRASIGYSTNFFVAATKYNPYIILPINDVKFRFLAFSIEGEALLIKYNAESFNDDRSGEVELRYYVKDFSPFMRFIS